MAASGPGDVGTGPCLDSAAEVFAFDLSATFVERCRRNRPTWKVCVADVLKLPFGDGEFDVSVIHSSLHHIASGAELVLAELARVTRRRVVFLEGVVPEKGLLRRMLLRWYAVMDGACTTIRERKSWVSPAGWVFTWSGSQSMGPSGT